MKKVLIGLVIASSISVPFSSAGEIPDNIYIDGVRQTTPNPGNPSYSQTGPQTGGYSPGMSVEAYNAQKAAKAAVCKKVSDALLVDVAQCKALATYVVNVAAATCDVSRGTNSDWSFNYTSGQYLKLQVTIPSGPSTQLSTCNMLVSAAATLTISECQNKAERIKQSACN